MSWGSRCSSSRPPKGFYSGAPAMEAERIRDGETLRLYRVRDNVPYLLATCEEGALGTALRTLHGEGEFDDCRVGVFDARTREWIVNPWNRGRAAE